MCRVADLHILKTTSGLSPLISRTLMRTANKRDDETPTKKQNSGNRPVINYPMARKKLPHVAPPSSVRLHHDPFRPSAAIGTEGNTRSAMCKGQPVQPHRVHQVGIDQQARPIVMITAAIA